MDAEAVACGAEHTLVLCYEIDQSSGEESDTQSEGGQGGAEGGAAEGVVANKDTGPNDDTPESKEPPQDTADAKPTGGDAQLDPATAEAADDDAGANAGVNDGNAAGPAAGGGSSASSLPPLGGGLPPLGGGGGLPPLGGGLPPVGGEGTSPNKRPAQLAPVSRARQSWRQSQLAPLGGTIQAPKTGRDSLPSLPPLGSNPLDRGRLPPTSPEKATPEATSAAEKGQSSDEFELNSSESEDEDDAIATDDTVTEDESSDNESLAGGDDVDRIKPASSESKPSVKLATGSRASPDDTEPSDENNATEGEAVGARTVAGGDGDDAQDIVSTLTGGEGNAAPDKKKGKKKKAAKEKKEKTKKKKKKKKKKPATETSTSDSELEASQDEEGTNAAAAGNPSIGGTDDAGEPGSVPKIKASEGAGSGKKGKSKLCTIL